MTANVIPDSLSFGWQSFLFRGPSFVIVWVFIQHLQHDITHHLGYSTFMCRQLVSNIWSAKQCQDPSSDPQRTQQITRSAFRISPQPDWQINNFKSWYVGGGSEPQFQCWFVDRLNQRLNFVCGRGYVLTISRLYLSGC